MPSNRTNGRLPVAATLLGLVAVVAACPDNPLDYDDINWLSDAGPNAGQIVLEATSKDEWTYLSFSAKGVVTIADPKTSTDWDLAFQRYNVRTNGGTSGPGQGAAFDMGKLDLETTTVAAVGEWVTDGEIADARTGTNISMNAMLSGWYDYHFIQHRLISKYHLYAVKAADGRVALFQIYNYYDGAGTAGHITINYRFPVGTTDSPLDGGSDPVDAGTPGEVLPDEMNTYGDLSVGAANIDARTGTTYVQFDADGPNVSATNFDGAWDLSFDLWLLRTNGGTSGSGQGASVKAAGTFAEATTVPESGWTVDRVQTIGAEQRLESTNDAFAGWFDYDPTNQKIRSKGETYWLKTHDGKYAKFELVGYYHPVEGQQGFIRLRWAFRGDGATDFREVDVPVP